MFKYNSYTQTYWRLKANWDWKTGDKKQTMYEPFYFKNTFFNNYYSNPHKTGINKTAGKLIFVMSILSKQFSQRSHSIVGSKFSE